MKSIKMTLTLFLQIPRLLLTVVRTGPRRAFRSAIGKSKGAFLIISNISRQFATTSDQSSLRIKESCRGKCAGTDRERSSKTNHGISRIVKGIDLDVVHRPVRIGFRSTRILIFKELDRFDSVWGPASLLPKKSYIKTKTLHFHNI